MLEKYFDADASLAVSETSSKKGKTFTLNEVEDIVESVCETLMPHIHDEDAGSLFDHDANYLRDIALKIENKEELTIKESLQLMELAHRARPDGPGIKRKIKEYKNIVEQVTP